MAESPPIHDISDTEFFLHSGQVMKTAIKEKVRKCQERVEQLYDALLESFENKEEAVLALICEYQENKETLAPAVLLAHNMAKELASVQKEIDYLIRFAHNIEEARVYKLSFHQLERFGL